MGRAPYSVRFNILTTSVVRPLQPITPADRADHLFCPLACSDAFRHSSSQVECFETAIHSGPARIPAYARARWKKDRSRTMFEQSPMATSIRIVGEGILASWLAPKSSRSVSMFAVKREGHRATNASDRMAAPGPLACVRSVRIDGPLSAHLGRSSWGFAPGSGCSLPVQFA